MSLELSHAGCKMEVTVAPYGLWIEVSDPENGCGGICLDHDQAKLLLNLLLVRYQSAQTVSGESCGE